jgi:hypothetical protein
MSWITSEPMELDPFPLLTEASKYNTYGIDGKNNLSEQKYPDEHEQNLKTEQTNSDIGITMNWLSSSPTTKDEEKRQVEEKRKIEVMKQAEEARKIEEMKQEEKRQAEEKRIIEEIKQKKRQAEEARKIEEMKQEEKRQAEEK